MTTRSNPRSVGSEFSPSNQARPRKRRSELWARPTLTTRSEYP